MESSDDVYVVYIDHGPAERSAEAVISSKEVRPKLREVSVASSEDINVSINGLILI